MAVSLEAPAEWRTSLSSSLAGAARPCSAEWCSASFMRCLGVSSFGDSHLSSEVLEVLTKGFRIVQ